MARRKLETNNPMEQNAAAHASNGAPLPGIGLEERLQRLEDAVAGFQDTRVLEERVVERVTQKLRAGSPRAPEVIVASAPPPRALLPVGAQAGSRLQTAWLVFELLADLRALLRIYTDRQYQASWLTRMTPVIALLLIGVSWFFVSGWPLVGPWLDRLFILLVAFVSFKILMREVMQYRQTVGDGSIRRAA